MGDSAPSSAGRVFISYRRDETAYPAGWLYDRLAEHFDGQVFKDIDSIELGDDWVQAITEAVASCDVMLALIGDEWLTITDETGRRRLDDPSDFVRLEIETALERDVRVIPILVDGAQMPRAAELPAGLSTLVRRQALELSPARFDFDTSRLLEVLDDALDEVRGEQEQERAASKTTGDRRSPDPRTTEQGTAAERTPDSHRGRFSTRRLILAGVGACAVVIAVLVSIALVNSDGTSSSTRTDDGSPGASFSTEPDGGSTPSEPGSDVIVLVASFEDGKEGWGPDPDQPGIGSVKQASDFHTHGSFSLQVDSKGVRGEGWYGADGLDLDITGKAALSVDIRTLNSGTQTAIAVQYGDGAWCQSRGEWKSVPAGTDLRTVTFELETLECVDEPASSSRNNLTAVWVWFAGDGSFRLDNVRVE